jgi:site-specific DNA-methyltransferase (adenine-specific)
MIDLRLGDCLEIMKDMPDKSVDLVLTSPPYNKNGLRGKRDTSKGKGRWSGADITYGDYMDDRDEQEYKEWQISLLNECYRVIKDTGSILYNHKVRRANGGASHPMEWISKCKAKFYQQIIWNRGSGPDHNIGYLDPITELVFWLVKETPKCHKDRYWSTEIWNIPPIPMANNHPAPFPEKLCSVAILLTTDKDDTILDPYAGSGTVGVACKELGRNFIGIEIDEKYFEIAKKRIANTQESMF